MNIIVCVKQVPGTTSVEVDPVTGVLRRDGVDSKLNPYDLYAIETAMCLAERTGGAVRTLTMGPPQAREALLETVYMGADEGILVSDRRFAGADVLATSYTLSQAVGLAGDFDLILCGKQTTDGDTAQVGAEMAEFLGIPHAGNVLSAEPEPGGLVVRLNQESRIVTQRMPLPCLLCMDGGVNTPRLPSYRRKRELTGDPVRVVTLDDFADRDERHYGLSGSPTQVARIFPPDRNSSREVLTGSGAELAARLTDILAERKYL